MRLETIDFLNQTTETKTTETPVGKKIKEAKDKIVVAKDTIKTTPIKEPFLKLKTKFKGLAQAPASEGYITPTQGKDYFNIQKIKVEGSYESALLTSLKEIGFDISDIRDINPKLNVNFDKAPEIKIDITIPKVTGTIDFLSLIKNITAQVSLTLEWGGDTKERGWNYEDWADTYTFNGNYEQISAEVERVTEELVKINDYLSQWYENVRNHFTIGYQNKRHVAIIEKKQGHNWMGISTLRKWVKNNGLILRALKNALLNIISQAISNYNSKFTTTINDVNKIIDDINRKVIIDKQNKISKTISDYNSYLVNVANSLRDIIIKTRDDSLAKLTTNLSQSFKLLDESQKSLIDALNILTNLLNSLKEIYAMIQKVKISEIPDMDTQQLISKIKESISYTQTQIETKLANLEKAIGDIAKAVGV